MGTHTAKFVKEVELPDDQGTLKRTGDGGTWQLHAKGGTYRVKQFEQQLIDAAIVAALAFAHGKAD